MDSRRSIKYSEIIFSGVFFPGIFIFFRFFYNSHLHFEEQFQLFLLTGNYLIVKLGIPGGFSGYIGEFLTQFYYLSFVGPLIIAGLLFALRQVVKHILSEISQNPALFPLSFIPSLVLAMILCSEFYPLSAVIGFVTAMLAALAYVRIRNHRSRFVAGIIFIPLTYWLTGGSSLSLLSMMLVYESVLYLRSRGNGSSGKDTFNPYTLKWQHIAAYLLAGSGIPLIAGEYFIMQPLKITLIGRFYFNIVNNIPAAILFLFVLPPLLMLAVYFITLKDKYSKTALVLQTVAFVILAIAGVKHFANFEAEQIMRYDYLVRNEKWKEVIRYADKKPPRNFLSLAMLNLSLAKTEQLGNRMFSYDQHGINGLFLPFNREYVGAIMGNEIFYHLGLINASQQYVFESMETIPSRSKSIRVIKRLAETNLINGQYKVSEKYLTILEKTIFYRKWANATRIILYDEEKINNDHDWGEKRRFMVRNDYFFHIKNIEAVLNRMVKEHPDNKMAFEYLMAYYMINKDLRNLVNFIPVMEKMNYNKVPVSYQEAIMYIIGLNNEDPMINSPVYVSKNTRLRMQSYSDIFNRYPDAKERLEERFSDTYWFYLHFKEVEPSQAEEKTNNTGST